MNRIKTPKIVLFDWNDTIVTNAVNLHYSDCAHIMIPDAMDFLNCLYADGVLMGVVSNKIHSSLVQEIRRLGLENIFTSIAGSGIALENKPSPIHVQYVVNEILTLYPNTNLLSYDECWFIGDSEIDVMTAINARCLPVVMNFFNKSKIQIQYLKQNKIPHIAVQGFVELKEIYNQVRCTKYKC